ncbi:DUF6461 domain-containing protein [Microbispora sp. H10836]|uniref:DUF6461 domain-containing protein n=1 Tax=Microbispora sp. H10836 TaxID=2729106 RepID=UPI0028931708|nr:DUF6461 domain-containing protein [Microbispora sp. H10836]
MHAAVAVGDWVLLVEAHGGLGVTEEIIMPLSAGTRLVSHFYLDVDGMDYFYWINDGAERLTGITMTPQLLEESTYLCGVVPGSR